MAKAIMSLVFAVSLLLFAEARALAAEKIIFIPLDNRPITCRETWEAGAKLGYDMVLPPDELLGSRDRPGDSEGLWRWLEKEAPAARAAVISTDAMLYGSLVESRNHGMDEKQILARAEKFRAVRQKFPRLRMYAFGTLLRTLSSPSHSGGMEPPDYQKYATQIYEYSAWRDKMDMGVAKGSERRKLKKAEASIPPAVLDAWETRHIMNYRANEYLTDLAREGVFSFFLLGGDDGARYSQTHYEMRHIRAYGQDIGASRFQVLSGADELAMLMLCRAVHDLRGDIPFVYTAYNVGEGRDIVPKYASETIGDDMGASIHAAGAVPVPDPARAEMIFAISTDFTGRLVDANDPRNTTKPRQGTLPFVNMVKDFLKKEFPVAVADIAYGNGADNALMAILSKEDLIFRLKAYGGWNTATNTAGFLIGDALLGRYMKDADAKERMLTRCLDDWGYQANVRQVLGGYLYSLPGKGDGLKLDEKKAAMSAEGTRLIIDFAKKNIALPGELPIDFNKIRLAYPWNRLFECEILYGES